MSGAPKMTPHAILEHMEHVRAVTLRRFEPLTQDQLDARPSASPSGEEEWSLGEIFMHLASDEDYLRDHIARPLLEGVQPPESVFFIPPPPRYGEKKETIAFWFDRARLATRRMIEALPADANLDLKHEGGLEPMNGLEWLMGYAGHEAFHHKQVDAAIAELSATAVEKPVT